MLDEGLRREWAQNVRSRRIDCGHSQWDLAVACHVTQTTIWRWETLGPDWRAPTDANKLVLARVLRTDVRSLFPMPVTEKAS